MKQKRLLIPIAIATATNSIVRQLTQQLFNSPNNAVICAVNYTHRDVVLQQTWSALTNATSETEGVKLTLDRYLLKVQP